MLPVSKAVAVAVRGESRAYRITREILVIVGASLFVALCAKVTWYLPFTPVPLSLQNFGVLLVGLLLGSRRGFAALMLYLAEGAAGMPVFAANSAGLLGPTAGYLFAYPVVALLAGWWQERAERSFIRYALTCVVAEIVLFAAGVSWLFVFFRQSLAQSAAFGLYPFLAAEVLKVSAAAGIATRWHKKAS